MYKNPEGVDVPVSIGGTWQEEPMRRSMVLFISVIPGEVLDCRAKTLYCHNCQIHQNDDKMLEVLDALQMPS